MLWAIILGLIIVLVIILLWFMWAFFIYRRSDERISNLILSAFSRTQNFNDGRIPYVKNIHYLNDNQLVATIAFQESSTVLQRTFTIRNESDMTTLEKISPDPATIYV
jgi:hypothetical protein